MTAAENADGVAVPPTGGRDPSPVPLADIEGTISAGHPEPSGCVTVFPILVSTSDGEHDEIVSDGSPQLPDSTNGAGTLSIASVEEPSEAISPNGAKSSAVDGAPRGGAAKREEPGETTEINQDHLGAFESAPDTRRIVQPPAAPIGNSSRCVADSTPSVSLIEAESRETSVSSSPQLADLFADSETGLQDMPEQIIAKDLEAPVQASSSVIDEDSVLNFDGKSLATAPATDFTEPLNTEDDQIAIERSLSHADSMTRPAHDDESETASIVEVRPGSTRTRGQSSNKRRSPQKYEAPVRTSDALTAPREARTATATMRTRALSIAVHAHFGRRNRCQVALLPERPEGLGESITVQGEKGLEQWSASQDEWYADLLPDDLGRILRDGARWEQVEDHNIRWTLAGREIYVLAGRPESGISAFVSTTRLLLGEEHIVLCTKGIEEAVRRAIVEAGCADALMFDENQGVPNGWLLFRNVNPTTALLHNPADGILNILRPVHDVEIELHGGIRIQYLQWLLGHPPQVRLRGQHDNLEVMIDQQAATHDENRNYTVPGWDTQGFHRAACGGATASYELIDPPLEWDRFSAFTYKTRADSLFQTNVCGPLVSTELQSTVLLERIGGTYLLGPVPGQVAFAAPAPGVRVPAFLGAADFPIVWAVPASPLLANKETSSIKLFRHELPEVCKDLSKPSAAVRLWASLVMEASYKRLQIDPAKDDARSLWLKYKSVARRIKRGSR